MEVTVDVSLAAEASRSLEHKWGDSHSEKPSSFQPEDWCPWDVCQLGIFSEISLKEVKLDHLYDNGLQLLRFQQCRDLACLSFLRGPRVFSQMTLIPVSY